MTESEASTILKAEAVHHPELSIFEEALELAIQALEKQIPMKPMMVYDVRTDSNWCSCPICANGIGWEIPARKIKFCWECGKRLRLE